MIQKLRTYIVPLLRNERFIYFLLVAIPVVLYFRWFNFDVFSYGDWSYKYVGNLKDGLTFSSWIANTNFGSANELIWRAPLDFALGLFAAAGWGINVSEKFLLFWPLALTSMVAPYFLVKEVVRNRWPAFFGALFYATNTYFLAINPQGQELLPLACNIATFALGVFIRAVRRRSMPHYVGAALLLWLSGAIDFRVFYIAAAIMAGFVLYAWIFSPRDGHRLVFKQLLSFAGLLLLFNISWLFATAMAGGAASDSVFSRSLFGGSYWDLNSAITLHHPFWTGGTTTWFTVHNPPFYFWAVPIAAFSALLFYRKNPFILFFGLISVIGILLSKQTSDPFSAVYPFLFSHLPGFNAFREATKFYYMVALGYTVLLGALIAQLQDRRHKSYGTPVLYGFFAVLAIVCFANAIPYLSGSMQKLLTPRTISADYQSLAHKFGHDDRQTFYRTLWVPIAPRWSYYDTAHPRVNATALTTLPQGNDGTVNATSVSSENIAQAIRSPLFAKYLADSSIKYVMVPTRDLKNQDDFYKFYGDDRQFYINLLDNSPAVRRVNLGTKDVVTYEVARTKPYAVADTRLYKVSDTADLSALYGFVNGQLKQSFTYALNTAKKPVKSPSTVLTELFDDLNPAGIAKGSIQQTINGAQNGTLYAATNSRRLGYSIANGQFAFQASTNAGLYMNNQLVGGTPQTTGVGSVGIDNDRQYYLQSGGSVVPLDTHEQSRDFGTMRANPSVISASKQNLVPNGSFEKGLWQDQAQDCNKYDNAPEAVAMNALEGDSTDGKWSVELSASSHVACMNSAKIPVTPGSQYLLSFDYKAPYAEELSFKVSFDNKDMPTTSHKLGNGSRDWRTIQEVITVPAGAHFATVQLRGTPPPTYTFSNEVAQTQYDNVRLQTVQTELDPHMDTTPQYQAIPVKTKSITLTAKDDGITGQNILQNGSLEKGLWHKKVEDCDNSDSNPRIGMKLTTDATQGRHGLELSAQHHVACTGPQTVAVKEGATYLLSFDHRSPNAKNTVYTISFNDPQRTIYKQTVPVTARWQTLNRHVTIPLGASSATVKVYAYPSAVDKAAVIQHYDNFQLVRVAETANQAFFVGQSPAAVQPKSVQSLSRSQTQKIVTVKGAKGPFYLTQSETYHGKWRLELYDGRVQGPINSWFPLAAPKTVATVNHAKANGYVNGWYVEPAVLCAKTSSACHKNVDGSYDLVLMAEFSAQRWEYATGIVSGVGIAAAVWHLVRRRLKRVPPARPVASVPKKPQTTDKATHGRRRS